MDGSLTTNRKSALVESERFAKLAEALLKREYNESVTRSRVLTE